MRNDIIFFCLKCNLLINALFENIKFNKYKIVFLKL